MTIQIPDHQAGKQRQSGIELLKILAIFLIVLYHVVQTLQTPSTVMTDQSYLIDYSMATTDWTHVLLAILSYCGMWGNTIFFVCSAWFLLESKQCDMKKWLSILVEVWVVSVLILLVTFVLRNGNISKRLIVKSLAPTLFANNWYLTCYLLFYPIHPYLNKVIHAMEQRTLLRCCAAMFLVYFVAVFLKADLLLEPHPILTWITIYFLIAYTKYYLPVPMDNCRVNLLIFVLAFLGHIGSVVFLNEYCLFLMPSLKNQLLRFCCTNNPFLLLMSVSLFHLARNLKLQSRVINAVSGLSMFIYIFHENILLRTYYRPALLQYIHRTYGYEHIFLIVFTVAAGIFLLSALCAWLYQRTLQKGVRRLSEHLLKLLKALLPKLEAMVLKIR